MLENEPDDAPEFTLRYEQTRYVPSWPVENFEVIEWATQKLSEYQCDTHQEIMRAMASGTYANWQKGMVELLKELEAFQIPDSEEWMRLFAAMRPDIGQPLLDELSLGREATAQEIEVDGPLEIIPVFRIIQTVRRRLSTEPAFVWNSPTLEEVLRDTEKIYRELYLPYAEKINAKLAYPPLDPLTFPSTWQEWKAILPNLWKRMWQLWRRACHPSYIAPLSFKDFKRHIQGEGMETQIMDWYGGEEYAMLAYHLRGSSLSSFIHTALIEGMKKMQKKESEQN